MFQIVRGKQTEAETEMEGKGNEGEGRKEGGEGRNEPKIRSDLND